MNNKMIRCLGLTMLMGCTVHLGDSGGGNAAEEFTDNVEISDGQRINGAPPTGTFDLPAATGSGGTVSPGNSFTIPVPTGVADVAAVNVSFGGGSYFRVPVNGTGAIAASAGNFCGNLSDVCHQIRCYEQVVTSSGTVSRQQALNMVLNCTGGTDCNGNQACTCTQAAGVPTSCRTTITMQYCICPNFSAYYLVNSRRFSIADARVASQTQTAATAAVNYAVSLCR